MKKLEREKALELRLLGYSILEISRQLNVAKSSASTWVRDVPLTPQQLENLKKNSHTAEAVEKRRQSRLLNESSKRELVIKDAKRSIPRVDNSSLLLIGAMLYWAEGGKSQRMVRFSNGDPEMIKIMMQFFRKICRVPERKFRGYIHIHPHLNYRQAEEYWSKISGIPLH
jgi:hypothetical protein